MKYEKKAWRCGTWETRRIERDRMGRHGRWYWTVEWDDGDDCHHGIGGWSLTVLGARWGMRRASRREAAVLIERNK